MWLPTTPDTATWWDQTVRCRRRTRIEMEVLRGKPITHRRDVYNMRPETEPRRHGSLKDKKRLETSYKYRIYRTNKQPQETQTRTKQANYKNLGIKHTHIHYYFMISPYCIYQNSTRKKYNKRSLFWRNRNLQKHHLTQSPECHYNAMDKRSN